MATTMQTEVKVTTDAIDVSQLESVELPDGWHDITGCELVQFALGEAHSPITPTKVSGAALSERVRPDGPHADQQDPELQRGAAERALTKRSE